MEKINLSGYEKSERLEDRIAFNTNEMLYIYFQRLERSLKE